MELFDGWTVNSDGVVKDEYGMVRCGSCNKMICNPELLLCSRPSCIEDNADAIKAALACGWIPLKTGETAYTRSFVRRLQAIGVNIN